MVHGWRTESEEPPPECDVIDHSETTKEYWAQLDLLKLRGGPTSQVVGRRWTQTMVAVDPAPGPATRGYDARSYRLHRRPSWGAKNARPGAATGVLEGLAGRRTP